MFPEKAKCANPVFYKSYSRLKEGGIRESWSDVCKRTLEGLKKLGKFTKKQLNLIAILQQNLITLPSGRWLWVGGSNWLEKSENYSGAFNCTSTVIDDWDSFAFVMELAMMGSGTGAVLEPENIAKLPPIKYHLDIKVLDNLGKNYLGENYTDITWVDIEEDRSIKITVGDSRLGWVEAYRSLMELASGYLKVCDDNSIPIDPENPYGETGSTIKVTVDLSSVRPKDTKLEGFGGVANPIKLPELFTRCAEILNSAVGRQLKPTECCLLIDEGAMAVVAGNIRRCIGAQERVTTSTGLKMIQNVEIGDLVLTATGEYKPVVNKFKQGVQEVVEIRTANAKLRCTANHKVAVFKDYQQYIWKRVKDLEWDDLLIVVKHPEGYELPEDMRWLKNSFPWNKSDITYFPVRCFDARMVGFVETYDLEVGDRHEFVCEGLLVSNSAGMRQFHQDDLEAAKVKLDLWNQDADGNWQIDPKKDALRMANHTRVFHREPTYEEILESVSLQYKCGEGAIQWAAEAIARSNSDVLINREMKNRFIDAYKISPAKAKDYLKSIMIRYTDADIEDRMARYGLNPCGEVLGHNFHCNLADIHLNQLNPSDIKGQEQAFEGAALIVCALLQRRFEEERYQNARELDPIVAVSFTGLFDFFVNHFGVDWLRWWQAGRPDGWGTIPANVQTQMSIGDFLNLEHLSDWFRKEEIRFLRKWRNIVENVVHEYCQKHNLKVPNRCTTVQPSGTKSLLTNACPGWHPPKAARFLRRITFGKNDPIALACIDYGYNVVPSQSSKDEQGNLLNDPFDERCHEWLVEIPCAVNWADLEGVDEIDISQFSAIAQLDFCMTVQQHWTGHNTSSTIEMVESEIEDVAKRIHRAIAENEGYVSATLLAKFYDKQTFPRLPFEPITKAEYEKLSAEVLSRRKIADFDEAIQKNTPIDYVTNDIGAAPCDSDKCLLPEMIP